MARLIVAVVNDLDAEHVVATLRDEKHRLTEIPSFGGFLHAENTTLLIGVEDDRAEREVLQILERECSPRDVDVPAELLERDTDLPAVVRHSGATIFLVELGGITRVGSDGPPA
jgi:uncharacterized protein YaaQ